MTDTRQSVTVVSLWNHLQCLSMPYETLERNWNYLFYDDVDPQDWWLGWVASTAQWVGFFNIGRVYPMIWITWNVWYSLIFWLPDTWWFSKLNRLGSGTGCLLGPGCQCWDWPGCQWWWWCWFLRTDGCLAVHYWLGLTRLTESAQQFDSPDTSSGDPTPNNSA